MTAFPPSESSEQRERIGTFSARIVIPWAAAACLAIGAAWLGQRYLAVRFEIAVLRDRNELTELALKSMQQQLEAERIITRRQLQGPIDGANAQLNDVRNRSANVTDPIMAQGALATLRIATLFSRLKDSPQALAVAVWDPRKQEGLLTVEHLPALAASEDYQLWVIDPQYPNAVDAGVFTVEPTSGKARVAFKAKQPVSVIDGFAVTRERKSGVPKTGGPFVLLGK